MRRLPPNMIAAIDSGEFMGDRRAVTRVTIQAATLGMYENTGQIYASALFPVVGVGAKELPNVKSVRDDRSVDAGVSSMTMELFNTKPLPPGTGPDKSGSFDLVGYYTFNRGRSSYAQTTWGHDPNDWQDMLVPDRIVRVYQGYGVDYDQAPENDPNLILTGVWMVDDVMYTADGLITVECRDLGRLLLDQIMYPEVVPPNHYPLQFETYHDVQNPPVLTGEWLRPRYDNSSNQTLGAPTQFGHHGADAVDGDNWLTYWVSEGYDAPDSKSSFVWLQAGNPTGTPLSGVRVRVRGGRYRVYLSVYTDTTVGGRVTGWNGKMKIPYVKAATLPDNGSGITYSQTQIVEADKQIDFKFPPVTGITKVRLTFSHLHKSTHYPHPYRAAVTDFQLATTSTLVLDGGTHIEGNYGDYTEIVKLLCAYGGFYWPEGGKQYLTGENTVEMQFPYPDAYLQAADLPYPPPDDPSGTPGRVWGDFQMSGTAGLWPGGGLGIELWDKKPLMDGVNYVKDILGFVFFVDEQGGVIFRSPNQFLLGNWLVDEDGVNAERTEDYITIEDRHAILGLRAKLSSRNVREYVFVANVNGQIGAISKGRVPHPAGIRRVGGWTDQNFKTNDECQIMADLITLRQLFTFRTNTLRIAANPAIQIDDQIKILERTTGDAYFHYVRGISSSWDLAEGKWVYDLTTNWLGDEPDGEWAIKRNRLAQVTQQFLLGVDPPPPLTPILDFGAEDWKYLAQPQLPYTGVNDFPVESDVYLAARDLDTSLWSTGRAGIGWAHPDGPYYGTIPRHTEIPVQHELWMRKTVHCVSDMKIYVRADNFAYLYVNGHKIAAPYIKAHDLPGEITKGAFVVPPEFLHSSGDQVIALHVQDQLTLYQGGDVLHGDVRVWGKSS